MLRSETEGDSQRLQRALKGLRAYQEAERAAPLAPMPVAGERLGARLRDYGGTGAPVLFIPSLINPPNILDLSAERSLLRWLAHRGHHILLLDWGTETASRRMLSVGGHVDEILLPLVADLPEPPFLVGYCIGGTMAAAAAQLASVRGLVTLAAPWHFSAYPEDSRRLLSQLWAGAQSTVASLGLLPMEVLQSAFWSLDPGRTIAKFEAFADMAPASVEASAFVTLEDWANDGPPLPEAAARELFEAFFADDLPGRNLWSVGGEIIEPGELDVPQLHVLSMSDRIVPRDSAIAGGEQRIVPSGHVGMIVGGRARELLWEPLDGWLSQCSNG